VPWLPPEDGTKHHKPDQKHACIDDEQVSAWKVSATNQPAEGKHRQRDMPYIACEILVIHGARYREFRLAPGGRRIVNVQAEGSVHLTNRRVREGIDAAPRRAQVETNVSYGHGNQRSSATYGTRVREGAFPAGAHRAKWDGRDETQLGELLPTSPAQPREQAAQRHPRQQRPKS
jgi:hypothetical protein